MAAVLLDSSCLRREGLASASMLELTRLAERGFVHVLLSDIALREFETQMESELEKHVGKAIGGISAASRSLRVDNAPDDHAMGQISGIENFRESCRRRFLDALSGWKRRCNAEVLQFSPAKIGEVIDDYFSGSGAFRASKSREDFPDALILSVVREAASTFHDFHFVTGDEHLSSAATNCGISCHRSLDEFLDSPVIAALRATLLAQQHLELVSSRLLSPESMRDLLLWMRRDGGEVDGAYLEGEEIEGQELLGSDIYASAIEGLDASQIRDLTGIVLAPSEDGDWALSADFVAECSVEYVTSWPSYYEINAERDVEFVSAKEVVELIERWEARFFVQMTLMVPNVGEPVDGSTFDIGAMITSIRFVRAALLQPAGPHKLLRPSSTSSARF